MSEKSTQRSDSQHTDLTRRHKDLTSQNINMTSDGRNMPPYEHNQIQFDTMSI